MAKNNVRTQVIDMLEAYANEHDLKFLWSIERRPDGCMTVQLKKGNDGFTYRITNREIEVANGNAKTIVDNIVEMIKTRLS